MVSDLSPMQICVRKQRYFNGGVPTIEGHFNRRLRRFKSNMLYAVATVPAATAKTATLPQFTASSSGNRRATSTPTMNATGTQTTATSSLGFFKDRTLPVANAAIPSDYCTKLRGRVSGLVDASLHFIICVYREQLDCRTLEVEHDGLKFLEPGEQSLCLRPRNKLLIAIQR
jgi:hypothetical protein